MALVATKDGTQLFYTDAANAAHGLFVTHARRLNDDLAQFIEGRMTSVESDIKEGLGVR